MGPRARSGRAGLQRHRHRLDGRIRDVRGSVTLGPAACRAPSARPGPARVSHGTLEPVNRAIFDDEHEAFRAALPRLPRPRGRAAHRRVGGGRDRRPPDLEAGGGQGCSASRCPEEFGGAGIRDFRFNAVLGEEIAATGAVWRRLHAPHRRRRALPARAAPPTSSARAGCRASAPARSSRRSA